MLGALCMLAGAVTVAAIVLGVRRHRPRRPFGWHLLIVSVALSMFGLAVVAADRWVPAFASAGPVLVVAASWLLAGVPLVFVRARSAGVRDRAGLLDALTFTAGTALLVWTFALDRGMPWYLVAYTVGDLICLGAVTRLLTASGRFVPAGHILGGGLLLMVAGDVALLSGYSAIYPEIGRLIAYVAVGLAALHPSMALLTEPAPPPSGETSRVRLLLLGLASLVAPGVLLARTYTTGTVVSALSAVTFLLVLVRMAMIMSSHRQALSRERALREATAALVSAVDTDQVSAAVRTSVAHLLRADVPHGVVLALAVPDDEATVRDASAAGAIVATRDLDWAVGVRLNQFPAVLRCPMVIGDRLTGVLHVGAPAWALPRLQRAVEVLAGQAALAIERIALSEEVARRNSEVYFRTLVQNTSDVILIVDEDDRIRYASPSAVTVFGTDPTGQGLASVFDPADHARLAQALRSARDGDGLLLGLDFRAACEHRAEVLVEMDCRDLRADETVAGLVLTLRDVTERRRLERQLTHQAFHDALTGLANRTLFADRLEHALARAARDGSLVGVMYLDLDDFKIVNDTLGHAVGDILLKTVAERLSGALRADDTAARLGGDEFAALIENVWDASAVEDTATRVLSALSAPVPYEEGSVLYAVGSIGITTTLESTAADELLKQADLALYVSKGAGKNQWRRYQRHLHDAMVERLELRSALDHAVHEGHFLLRYQPVVDLRDEAVVGFEALVRWHHPTRGVIAPDEFLEVAEESGLIVPIGRWVFDEALHTLAQWHRVLPRARRPYVSVNVSARQLREPGFAEYVVQALTHAAVSPGSLMLEAGEDLLAADDVWPALAALRERGALVAVDDFGGAALLGRPIDVVKLDRTVRSPELVAGATAMGLTVIAEGVEDVADRDLLLRLGCPYGQGFLFAGPVDGTEAISQMTNRQTLAA